MKSDQNQVNLSHELSHEDQMHIRSVFQEEIVPKLIKYEARIGNLNCGFAGEKYKNWSLQFKSVGSSFEITEFECDEAGNSIDLVF